MLTVTSPFTGKSAVVAEHLLGEFACDGFDGKCESLFRREVSVLFDALSGSA
jgi:hypothetical protein